VAIVHVDVFGHCRLRPGGTEPVDLTATQRRVVARLALDAPALVDAETLAAAVWDDGAPATARAALHNQISRVRRIAGPDAIRTEGTHYALDARIDVREFVTGARRAHELLEAGRPAEAFDAAHAALGLWRGTPFADLDHVPDVAPQRQGLESARYTAQTTRLAAAVELGRLPWALSEAHVLATAAPQDERRAALLAQALHRSGRRGEALDVITAVRRILRTRRGIEPGAELAAVEAEILAPAAEDRAAGHARAQETRYAPFVGRQAELARCLAATDDGGLVRVTGEPGVGVSRFLRELRRRLATVRGADSHGGVVLVRCPAHSDTALTVLEEILDELDVPRGEAGVLADFGPTLAVRGAPVTILVDDAHLAGPTTLAALVAAAELPGVTVLLGGRPAVPGEPAGLDVRLEGLDGDALAAIVRHRLEASGHVVAGDQAVAAVVGGAGGNPLVVELLADALPATDPHGVGHGGRPGSRDGLAALVDRWRSRLSRTEDSVLEMVAVIGDAVPVELLSALTGQARAAFDSLLTLSPDGRTVAFRHTAVRDVVYQGISTGRREELHHAVAEASHRLHLPPAVVAHHRLAAAALDRRAAVSAAQDAARAASTVGAHADAVEWLVRVVEHAAGLGVRELLTVRIALGDSMRLAGIPAHLELLLDCAEEAADAGHVDLLADATFALLQLGGSSDVGAVNERVARVTRRAIEVLGEDEETAGIRAAASLAWSMTGEPARARELFVSAERAATSERARRAVLPFAYLGLGLPGDVPRRAELARELVGLAEAADDPVALFEGLQLEVSTRVALADGTAAREALERMHGLIDLVGDVGRRWQLLYLSAALAHLDGDLDRCEDHAWRALQLLAPVSPARAAAAFHAQVLVLRLSAGRVAELTATMRTLVAEQSAIPAWHAALALCLSAADPVPTAELDEHLRLALDHTTEDFTWLAGHVIGARAAARGASREIQDEYARRLAPHSDLVCWQGTCSYGPVAVPLAQLAAARSDDDAPAIAARARALCESLGAPVFARELEPWGL